MTIAVTQAVAGPYAGNGATTAFPFGFKAFTAAEVAVYTSVDGAAYTLLPDSEYTVTRSAGEGGTITFGVAPATGTNVLIVAVPSFDQDTAFLNGGAFLPESHDDALDRAALRDIYLKGLIDRAISVPVGDATPSFPSAADIVGGEFLAFDADKNLASSSGTGADAGLRTDMAANSGFSLIKHKLADANAYGRSAAALARVGGNGDHNIMHWVDPALDDALLDGSNATDVQAMLENAIANVKAAQLSSGRRQRLYAPPVQFLMGADAAFDIDCDGLVLDMHGAELAFTGASFIQAALFSGNGMTINGGRFATTIGAGGLSYVEMTGANEYNGVEFARPLGAVGIPVYVRQGASGSRFNGGKLDSYGGFNLFDASDIIWNGFEFTQDDTTGTDDCVAIKATLGNVSGIKVIGGKARNKGNVVGIGSQVGYPGAADPTYSRGVYGTIVDGVTCENVVSFLLIKHGGIQGSPGDSFDCRDGTVAGTRVANCTARDTDGTFFQCAIAIRTGRGARTLDTEFTSCYANGRLLAGAGARLSACLDILNIDLTATMAGTAPVEVAGVTGDVTFRDPYAGAAAGGSAPGSPASNFATIECATPLEGTVTGVDVTIIGDGCLLDGISIGPGFAADAIRLNPQIANVNTDGSGNIAGVQTASPVRIAPQAKIGMLAGHPYAITGAGDILCPELDEEVFHSASLGGGSAGVEDTQIIWRAPSRCQLIEILLMNTVTTAQNATNYSDFQFRNQDGVTGNVFASFSTNTTGASGNNPKLGSLTAFEWAQLYHLKNLLLDAAKTETQCASGARLKMQKINTGTGINIAATRVTVRAAPY